jgi:hypothetical protein
MALPLKLISENPDFFENFEIIEEQSNRNSSSNLYISGPMIGCNIRNKNGRWYDLDETSRDVDRYINEMVAPGRAMGELGHPNSPEINLERSCHIVTELHKTSEGYNGRAKVLSAPMGQLLRSLINDGVKVGVSTRALGQIEEHAQRGNVVKNMYLVAIDAVADPSYPKGFVNGILESASFLMDHSGRFEPVFEDFNKALKTLPKHDVDNYLRAQIIKFINSI